MKEKICEIGLPSNDQDSNRKQNLDRKLSPGITCFPLSAPAGPALWQSMQKWTWPLKIYWIIIEPKNHYIDPSASRINNHFQLSIDES